MYACEGWEGVSGFIVGVYVVNWCIESIEISFGLFMISVEME